MDDSEGIIGMLDQVGDLAQRLMGADAWQLSDAESRAAVAQAFAGVQKLQAIYLNLVLDLDQRPEAVASARPGTTGRTFLAHVLHRTPGQAAADVRAAHALAADADPALGGLPQLGAALAAGDVSREHVQIAVQAMANVPRHLLAAPALDAVDAGDNAASVPGRCGGDVLDEVITQKAGAYDTRTLARLAQHLAAVLDPDGTRCFDPGAAERRGLSLGRDQFGMTTLRGELSQDGGALLEALIDQLSKPDPSRTETTGSDGDETLIEIKDTRTPRQRRADGLVQLARLAAASLRTGARTGEPPRITIITTLDDLAEARAAEARDMQAAEAGDGSGPSAGMAEYASSERVDPGLLARFSCDSVLQRVLLAPSGAVLDLGRDVRTVTPAQRRALNARDRGCVVPGCTAPAHWCEAHHVQWFRDGGRTDIANLALVCSRHHTEIHQGIWILEMRDGVPWARPPDWLDAQRRPIRNTYHDDVRQIRDLGTQLRLNYGDGDPGPPIGKAA